MDTQELVETLAATPVWLRGCFLRLSEANARVSPGAGQWSAADVLAHLRASDAILAPRVFQILARHEAPLIGFDERAWAALAARAQASIAMQLAAFEAVRAELVGVLKTLSPGEWAAVGHHETRGALTVREIVEDLASHEREHRMQIETLVQNCDAHASEVGSKRAGGVRGASLRRRSHGSSAHHASA